MARLIRANVPYYIRSGDIHLSAATNAAKGNIYEIIESKLPETVFYFEHANASQFASDIYAAHKLYMYTIINNIKYYATFFRVNKSFHNYTAEENDDKIVYLRPETQMNASRSVMAMKVQLWAHEHVDIIKSYNDRTHPVTTHDKIRITCEHPTRSLFGETRIFGGAQTEADVVNSSEFQLVLKTE